LKLPEGALWTLEDVGDLVRSCPEYSPGASFGIRRIDASKRFLPDNARVVFLAREAPSA
jgi:hypothetical protein